MLIYSTHITPRLQYVAEWLGEQTGTTPVFTDNQISFEQSSEIKINYSDSRISNDEIWIKPQGLLNETNIHHVSAAAANRNHFPVLFENESDLGFDYMSAVFYLISRYEEYFPYQKDIYGRYPHQDSAAYRNNFLDRPLIDEWSELLIKKIKTTFPDKSIHPPSFSLTPTYDIDLSWSYLGKGFLRNAGGFFKNPNTAFERMAVLTGFKKDPYDCYAFLKQLHETRNLNSITFFLAALKRSDVDKNISPLNQRFRILVKSIAAYSEVGIHPSGYSYANREFLQKEREVIEKITDRKITKSRFHFLKCTIPQEYRRLLEIGITDDYTMGYGTINGFRASTSRSFYWYDLENEHKTSLRIHPFCWMDANAYYEQKMSLHEAYAELVQYLEAIKKVNGTMITVSHNHILGTSPQFEGWMDMYLRFMEKAVIVENI
jgi:hypothetical protein